MEDLISDGKVTRGWLGVQIQDIDEGITYILNLISESLQIRDRVEIRGFGSFSARNRASRIARNPNTGDAISIGSKYHPYFIASKSLKADLIK